MNDVTHLMRIEARKSYLVKSAEVEEVEMDGKPTIRVKVLCYYASDSSSDVDKLVAALRRKLPRGYTLRLNLEFCV